jgi:hypothetical protein
VREGRNVPEDLREQYLKYRHPLFQDPRCR